MNFIKLQTLSLSRKIIYRKTLHINVLCSMLNHGSSQVHTTASINKQEIISKALVKEISKLSATVKLLKLEIKDDKFSFKAGQWVDMFIPGVPVVGGFSICSPPHLLQASRMLHLAIKYSNHPPAHWAHTQCKVGDSLHLRAGGKFVYDPDPVTPCSDLVLIAGGVGINPLFCILHHFLHVHNLQRDSNLKGTSKVVLLYSAQSPDELIFLNELLLLSENYDNVTIKFFSTKERVKEDHFITNGRIHYQVLESILKDTGLTKGQVYICGPLSFIETMEVYSKDAGFSRDCIFIERWW
ncbi:oxidoreductase NAD-binding domain-containing protein 1 [Biomphalaria glabrata]|nr:oxidoreductase NAD-binding domain-containing protein 1 [Biomphalaria glabrata]